MTDPTQVLTTSEVADIWRITPRRAAALLRRGEIPNGWKIGREWRCTRADLDQAMRPGNGSVSRVNGS